MHVNSGAYETTFSECCFIPKISKKKKEKKSLNNDKTIYNKQYGGYYK